MVLVVKKMKRSEVQREKLSPMMQQYMEIKDKYEDCIIFFRLGDFYEMFFDDAILASRVLELTLTGKQAGLEERVPMCGIPHHAYAAYVDELIEKGYKVAICEQLEDPKLTKGMVKRDVIQVVTKGTRIDENIDSKSNNYIANIYSFDYCYGISFADISTGEVYAMLVEGEKEKVIKELLQGIDQEIYQCTLCQNIVERFPNSNTVYLGKNNDIVLIGEAPANNGWRKSHMLWKDINGKVLPSGVILQKLFDIINKDIFETTFLESVKCFPVERKNIKTCSKNCKQIMEKQVKILQPKLIITLGEFPTRNLLDFKFKKFQEVVGNIYEVNGYQILPIYHPSPISPKSYKGNIPIFEKLYNMNYNKNEN